MLLDLLQQNPVAFLILALCLVMSLTLHEWGHAFTADRLGDSTPRRFGRVTLNPLRHLDPIGTLLLLFVGFGFAKPVPVNGERVGRWGMLMVALAGPLMNIAVAILCLILLSVAGPNVLAFQILGTLLSLNLVLAIFNLLPIPLLDGSRIVAALFPRYLGRALADFERQPFSFVLVMIFIYIAREPIFQIVRTVRNFALGVAGFA